MIRRLLMRGGQLRSAQGQEDESGQGLAEYALILALIALVCAAALGALGQAIVGSPGFTTLPGAF